MSKPSIMVLSPVAKYRHPENFQSLQRMAQFAELDLIECFNHSEVSRARQVVASAAYRKMMSATVPDFVLWWDADMVMHDPASFLRHIEAVNDTGLTISGRYPMRQKQSLAASQDQKRESFSMNGWELEPVLAGMGCLLMLSSVFRDQVEASPVCRLTDGSAHQYLICAPRIVEHEETGHAMISEDYDYCMSLKEAGGVWYASKEGAHIDYAHMVERPMVSTPGAHGYSS